MAKHSFVCNCCSHFDVNHEPVICEECNGQGSKWEPACKEKYEENPQEYMKNLILGSQ